MSAQLHLRVPPGALEFKKQQHQARGLSRSLIASQARGHDCKHGSLAPQQHDRKVQAAAAAATLAAAPVSSAGVAAFPALQTVVGPWLPYVMAGAAACCAGLTLMMLLFPGAAVTQRSARSNLPLILLAVLYGVVLVASWSTDTLQLMMPGSLHDGLKGGFNPQFFPTLGAIQSLFTRPFASASFLLHVAVINLVAARSAYLDGFTSRVPTFHSILLCSVVGPLGLLSHQVTKLVYAAVSTVSGRDVRPSAKPIVTRSMDGIITILPYDK